MDDLSRLIFAYGVRAVRERLASIEASLGNLTVSLTLADADAPADHADADAAPAPARTRNASAPDSRGRIPREILDARWHVTCQRCGRAAQGSGASVLAKRTRGAQAHLASCGAAKDAKAFLAALASGRPAGTFGPVRVSRVRG